MNKKIALLLCLSFSMIFIHNGIFADDLSGNKLTWYSLKEGLEKASNDKKPIIVNFIASLNKAKSQREAQQKRHQRKNIEYSRRSQSCEEIKSSLFEDNVSYADKLRSQFILVKLDLSTKLSPEEQTFRNEFIAPIGKIRYGVSSNAADTYIIPKGTESLFSENGKSIKITTIEEGKLKINTKSVTIAAMADGGGDYLVKGKGLTQTQMVMGTQFAEIAAPFIYKPYVDNCSLVFMDSKGNVIPVQVVFPNSKKVLSVDSDGLDVMFFENKYMDYILTKGSN